MANPNPRRPALCGPFSYGRPSGKVENSRESLFVCGHPCLFCSAFPALSAIEEGFEVFAVMDAPGTFNDVVRDAAWSRMSAAGVQMMTWFGVACELHRDLVQPHP